MNDWICIGNFAKGTNSKKKLSTVSSKGLCLVPKKCKSETESYENAVKDSVFIAFCVQDSK